MHSPLQTPTLLHLLSRFSSESFSILPCSNTMRIYDQKQLYFVARQSPLGPRHTPSDSIQSPLVLRNFSGSIIYALVPRQSPSDSLQSPLVHRQSPSESI